MYKYIVNPHTNRQVQINSRLGKKLISNYNKHRDNILYGGIGVMPIILIISIGNIGYYYLKTNVSNSDGSLEELNEMGYLKANYPKLASQLENTIQQAEITRLEIEKEFINTVKNYDDLDLELSKKEQVELETELDNLVKQTQRGGAFSSVLIPIVIRMGGVSITVMIANYIWDTYLTNTQTNTVIQNPNVTSYIEDGWEIIVLPNESDYRLLNKLRSLEQIQIAKRNLRKRYKLLNSQLDDPKYKKLSSRIKMTLKQIEGQFKNLTLIEMSLKKTGATISARVK